MTSEGTAKEDGDEEPREGADKQAEARQERIDWEELIQAATAQRPEFIVAETYLGKWNPSAATPVKMRCSDGRNYAVKAKQAGRQIFNDQVAARLGHRIGAPVPQVSLIAVTQEVIDVNPNDMGHMHPGTSHGSVVFEDCTDKTGFTNFNDGDNRTRFASLAIFFGWMGGQDQQCIYRKSSPRLVHSVDHGHFFHADRKAPNWTVGTLTHAPKAEADAPLTQQGTITAEELADACAPLRAVSAEHIAEVIAIPPDDWGVGLDERVALAEYLYRRKSELIEKYLPEQGNETETGEDSKEDEVAK